MNEQAIAIFCICDEVVKSYGFHENPTCKMTTAEVMTFAIISTPDCDLMMVHIRNYFLSRSSHVALKIRQPY